MDRERLELPLATEEMYLRRTQGRDTGPRREVLTFVLSGELYGIEIVHIREIIKLRELTEVPRTPRFLIGVVSVRGVIIPVIDLRMRLRLDLAPIGRSGRVLVVMREEDRLGLLVDDVRDVVRFAQTDIEPTPSTLLVGDVNFLAGIGRYVTEDRKDQMVILLDLAPVLRFDVQAAVRREKRA